MKKTIETIKREIFTSRDGQRFTTESDCRNWEQKRADSDLLSNLHAMSLEIPFLYDNGLIDSKFFLLTNVYEMGAVIRNWARYCQYVCINGSYFEDTELSLGDWVARAYVDDDDCGIIHKGVYTLSFIAKKMSKSLGDIQSLTIDGMY